MSGIWIAVIVVVVTVGLIALIETINRRLGQYRKEEAAKVASQVVPQDDEPEDPYLKTLAKWRKIAEDDAANRAQMESQAPIDEATREVSLAFTTPYRLYAYLTTRRGLSISRACVEIKKAFPDAGVPVAGITPEVLYRDAMEHGYFDHQATALVESYGFFRSPSGWRRRLSPAEGTETSESAGG